MADDCGIVTVMAVYNGAAFIEAAITSVLGQSLPPHRILVVDDGSTDDSAACAIAAGAGRVTVLSTDRCGQIAARNRGIAAATEAQYIHLFDADDVMPPGAMAAMHRSLDAHPEWGGVFGSWENFWIDALADEARNPAVAHLHGRKTAMIHNAGLFRKALFDRFGLIPGSDIWHASPLWLSDLLRAGVEFGTVPDKTLDRRLHFHNASRKKTNERLADLALELHRRARAARAAQSAASHTSESKAKGE
jgi:glycosyltransferase involved in cell wall biosynthesis